MLIYNSTYRQGASHIKKGLVCQDYAASFETETGDIILALSDGHGSEKHFRSDIGSKFAVEVAMEAAKEFLMSFDSTKMLGTDATAPYVRAGVPSDPPLVCDGILPSNTTAHIFAHFARAIILRWHCEIMKHWQANPIDSLRLPEQVRATFHKEGQLLESMIPKAYGCTLMLAVRTRSYWFALHIGDGKIIAFRSDGTAWEPVPWDSACFSTTTTSLCELDERRTRFAYGSNPDDVAAIFLGSDGMDDSFPDIEALMGSYGNSFLRKIYETESDLEENNYLDRLLDHISKNRSGDDMSVAYWVDMDFIPSMMPKIAETDVMRIKAILENYDTRLNQIKILYEQNEQHKKSIEEENEKLAEGPNVLERIKGIVCDFGEKLEFTFTRIQKACDDSYLDLTSKKNANDCELIRVGAILEGQRRDIEKLENAKASYEGVYRRSRAFLDSLTSVSTDKPGSPIQESIPE